jgi:hypothetical protein
MEKKNENIENLLGSNKKDYPFSVPEGYFETFHDRLKVRIAEENQPDRKRSLIFYLKPVLMMAASIVLVMLLVSVPIKKFFPSGKGDVAQLQLNINGEVSNDTIPSTLISYFSEGQFLSAVSDMNELESDTLSADNLADYIAFNYSDYDIISNK